MIAATPIAAPIEYRLASASPGASFIQQQGTSLTLNGKPFRFVGYNQYSLNSGSNTMCGSVFTETQVNSLLDEIKTTSHGGVVRTWFYQGFANPAKGWSYFDRVIASAKARGIYLIPALTDQWGDCEPNAMYKSLSWYQGGFRSVQPGYTLSYADYVRAITARYANEPTIAFWQLVNEAEAASAKNGSCDETSAANAMKQFADATAASIRSVDKNHLINLGTIGSGQCGTRGQDYQNVQSGTNLNILEYHDYNDNLNPLPGDSINGLRVRLHESIILQKPLFIGEAGILSNVQPNGSAIGATTAATLQLRAHDFEAKMIAQFQQNIVGFLIWNKGFTSSISYDVGVQDPIEPVMANIQNLFSLYDPNQVSSQILSLQIQTTPETTSTNPVLPTVPSITPTVFMTPSQLQPSSPVVKIVAQSMSVKNIPTVTPAPTTTDSSLLVLSKTQIPLTHGTIVYSQTNGSFVTRQINKGMILIPNGAVLETLFYDGHAFPLQNVGADSVKHAITIDIANTTSLMNATVQRKSAVLFQVIFICSILLFLGFCIYLFFTNLRQSCVIE